METKATAGLTDVNMVRSISEIFDDVQRQMERNASDEQSGGTSSSHKKLTLLKVQRFLNFTSGLFENAMRSELKAKAFKSQAESARSRRLGRGKTDGGASVGEGGEKAATASETTSKVGRDLDILYSVGEILVENMNGNNNGDNE
ncbi:unnamed protein product, partial [Anisakis simplex]|uniref:FANCI_S4 domain-containing protein n=1 Tax=Anisakis simplex TaxID=6269 RepID=A0A0M3JBZ6_ANISI